MKFNHLVVIFCCWFGALMASVETNMIMLMRDYIECTDSKVGAMRLLYHHSLQEISCAVKLHEDNFSNLILHVVCGHLETQYQPKYNLADFVSNFDIDNDNLRYYYQNLKILWLSQLNIFKKHYSFSWKIPFIENLMLTCDMIDYILKYNYKEF